jgi:hypothetical protein
MWKKRGDYQRIRLRLGAAPYYVYVGVYPFDILDSALDKLRRRKVKAMGKRSPL